MQVETTRQTCPAPSDVLTADRFRVAGFAILLGLFSTAALAQSRARSTARTAKCWAARSPTATV